MSDWDHGEILYDVSCPACDWTEACGPRQLQTHLRKVGMMRRNDSLDENLIVELTLAAADRFTCPDCGSLGLALARPVEKFVDWSPAVRCQACGRPIPPERVEAMPSAKFCVNCQQKDDRNEAKPDPEFCTRCGSEMTWRQSGSEDNVRFMLFCSKYPRCGS
ncbi:MAG: TraR/DksA C4-type zinc finger protein [Planctomycetales bacterium]